MTEIKGKIILPPSKKKDVQLSDIIDYTLQVIFSHSENDSFAKTLNKLYSYYLDKLKEQIKVVEGTYQVWISPQLREKVERTCQILEQIIYNYSQGTISTAYRNFINDIDYLLDGYRIREYTIEDDSLFYRMRCNSDHLFNRQELFHVPFEKRGFIKGNNRYSIAGYPCLYLSNSVYGCWTEINPANINQVSVACLKTTRKYRLADFRFYQPISSNEELETYLRILPIIAACSFRAPNRESFYIPEYIIPQMLLHTIVKAPQNNNTWIEGIVYNPIIDYDNCLIDHKRLNVSLVLPVGKIWDRGICTDLCKGFFMSNPYCVPDRMTRDEILKQIKTENEYNNTIFGKIESRFTNDTFEEVQYK